MAVFSSILGKVAALTKGMSTGGVRTSATLPMTVNPWGASVYSWSVEHTRLAVHNDISRMDQEDDIIATGLDVIADCATGYEATDQDAFRIVVEGNPEAQQIADDMVERLSLKEEAWDIIRNMVRFGNEPREIVVNDSMDIVRLKPLPEEEIWPCRDKYGVPLDPPYEQRVAGQEQGKGIPIQEYQIVIWQMGPLGKHGMATPMLAPARKNWRRLTTIEDGMALARMIRAYQKLVHRVPVNSNWSPLEVQQAVQKYKENITKKEILNWSSGRTEQVNDPLTVETDFFVPEDGQKRGGIDSLDPKNNQLENISDVQYAQSRMLCRLKVPRRYLNIEGAKSGGINAEGSDAEDLQFARVLRKAQTQFRKGLRKVLHLQWFLNGVDYRKLKYRIDMPKVSTADAKRESEIMLNNANAAVQYQTVFGNTLDPEFIFLKFMGLDADDAKIQAANVDKNKKANEEKALKIAAATPAPDPMGSNTKADGTKDASNLSAKGAGHEKPSGKKKE